MTNLETIARGALLGAAMTALLAGCSAGPRPVISATLAESPQDGARAEGPSCTLEPVFYDFDEAHVRADQRVSLRGNVACFHQLSEAMGCPALLELAGHTDEHGTDEYNLLLGERVARGVATALSELGVARDRIVTLSYGETRPAVPGATREAEHARNRRVEFAVRACP